MREVLKRERLYAVQGNEWYGWWVGRLPDGRQVLAAPGRTTLYLAVFDADGGLQHVLSRPDPLQIDARIAGRDGVGPQFDVAELEAYLSREFGGFERATIRVRPFVIPEIGVELNPLHPRLADFLDDPDDFADEEQEDIREWIEAGCSELLYGNNYFLGGDGKVDSS